MISYLKKGSPVVATGEIQKPEIYTDREGKPQISLGMTAFNLSFSPFGRGKSEDGANQGGQRSQASAPSASASPVLKRLLLKIHSVGETQLVMMKSHSSDIL